jgi:hypothetical protein
MTRHCYYYYYLGCNPIHACCKFEGKSSVSASVFLCFTAVFINWCAVALSLSMVLHFEFEFVSVVKNSAI